MKNFATKTLIFGLFLLSLTSFSQSKEATEKAIEAGIKKANPGFDGKIVFKYDPKGNLNDLRIQDKKGAISDLSSLKDLPLVRFSIDGAAIQNAEFLRGKNLKWVVLMRCQKLTDISALAGMPLESVTLYASRALKDISPLKDAKLKHVNIEATSVADLSALKGQPIANARLCTRFITDISPLADNEKLKVLDFTHAKGLTDLSPLTQIPNIRDLRLDSATVSDITPISSLKKLMLLSVKDCPNVKSLKPLKDLKLKVLVFTPKYFSKEEINFIRNELKNLEFIDVNYKHWKNNFSGNPSPERPVCTSAKDFWQKYDKGEIK